MKTLLHLLPKTHQNRIISLVLFFGLIFTVYNVALMERFENRFLKDTAEETVRNQHATITPSLADALLYDDIYSIFRIIDTITQNIPFISNIYIMDEHQGYVTDAKVTRTLPALKTGTLEASHYRYFSYPIQTNMKEIGTILFEVDQNVLTAQVRERLIMVISLACLGTALIAYLSFAAVVFLLKPLRNISRSLKSVDAENLPVYFDLPEYTSTEVRKLANALHTMSKSLKQAMDTNADQQREMAQQEKLAAIGMVSAGLAHELKNPAMSLQLLTQKVVRDQGESPSRDIEVIQQEVSRIVETINAFQHYTKPVEADITTVSSRSVAQHAVTFSRQYLPGLRLQCVVDPHFEWASDESILTVILDNMLKNAHQAKATECILTFEETNTEVFITIGDNGVGISDNDMEKIFMPFYSTKSDGTGLGLALVDKMLARIQGSIQLIPSTDMQTQFMITLRK